MNKKEPTTGEKFHPILQELHDAFWEADLQERPYHFPNDSLKCATKIFITLMMDELWKRIEKSEIDIEIGKRMAQDLGEEIRGLVKKWTFKDSHKFYK